jgi:hypothetical protein
MGFRRRLSGKRGAPDSYRSRLALTSAALGHRAGPLRYDQIVVIRFGRSWGVEWTGQRQWQAGCRQIKRPAALSNVRRGMEVSLSLPPPGGNGLD